MLELSQGNISNALANLTESVKVKQENEKLVFAHLLAFLLFDEELAPQLGQAAAIVQLSGELMLYEEATCFLGDDTPQAGGGEEELGEVIVFKAKYLHMAMRQLSSFAMELELSPVNELLQFYNSLQFRVLSRILAPALSPFDYLELNQEQARRRHRRLRLRGARPQHPQLPRRVRSSPSTCPCTPSSPASCSTTPKHEPLWHYARLVALSLEVDP